MHLATTTTGKVANDGAIVRDAKAAIWEPMAGRLSAGRIASPEEIAGARVYLIERELGIIPEDPISEPLTNMTNAEIAERLVALCREGKFETAQKELFAPDVISVEPYATPSFPKETRGLNALLEKGQKFTALIEEVHSISISDPLVAGSSFACAMQLDLAIRGHGRMTNHELCIYEVKDGKIASEQFTSRFHI